MKLTRDSAFHVKERSKGLAIRIPIVSFNYTGYLIIVQPNPKVKQNGVNLSSYLLIKRRKTGLIRLVPTDG
jgi:hypothetical protein